MTPEPLNVRKATTEAELFHGYGAMQRRTTVLELRADVIGLAVRLADIADDLDALAERLAELEREAGP